MSTCYASSVEIRFPSLLSSLDRSRLDYSNPTLAGVPSHLLSRFQSVMNAAARLPTSLRSCASSAVDCFQVCSPGYKCLHGSALSYLIAELCQMANVEARQRQYAFQLVFVTDRHPTRLSVPSATELFQSLLLMSGTVCLNTT